VYCRWKWISQVWCEYPKFENYWVIEMKRVDYQTVCLKLRLCCRWFALRSDVQHLCFRNCVVLRTCGNTSKVTHFDLDDKSVVMLVCSNIAVFVQSLMDGHVPQSVTARASDERHVAYQISEIKHCFDWLTLILLFLTSRLSRTSLEGNRSWSFVTISYFR
jgi:hypothetical protein